MKKFLFPMLSIMVLAAVSAVPVLAAQNRVSNVETYSHSDGVSYFEFGLQTPQVASQFGNEVVFLFDTSASQVGPVRREQFAALKSAVKHLPAATKVQLFSVDVDTQAYTVKFVDSQSKELAAAIAKLENNNVPLGSTDLPKALDVALTTFAKQGTLKTKRTVLYIGDGRSSGKVMLPAIFDDYAKKFAAAKISFSACPMGVASNFGIVGALANRTGGLIVSVADVDANHAGYEIGEALALSVGTSVFWPDADTVKIPTGWEIYPATLPPLRSDRETILLGKTSAKIASPKLSATLRTFDGRAGQLVWDLAVSKSNVDNQYLVSFVELASADDGATMPIAGRTMLETMKDLLVEQQSAELAVAEEALKSGQNEAAVQIARQIAKRTNNSNEAAKNIIERAESNETSISERLGEISSALPTLQGVFDDDDPFEIDSDDPFAVGDDEENTTIGSDVFGIDDDDIFADPIEEDPFGVEAEDETGLDSGFSTELSTPRPTVAVPTTSPKPSPIENTTPTAAPAVTTESILDRVEAVDVKNTIDAYNKSNDVRVQSMAGAVNKSLADAEKLMQTNPESALLGLKMMKAELTNDSTLPPNDRLRLIDALETKMKSAYHNKEKAELLQIQRDANIADKKHRELIVGRTFRTGEKVKQIFQRFDSLISEGMYSEADVAAQAATTLLPPTRSAGVTASLYAHTMGSVMEIESLRFARQRGVIEVLMNVERSFVPLSDEPPLIYPDPEIWRRLSEKRTADWSAVDLSSSGEMEKRIIKALDSVAEIDNENGMTLQDLADMLKQQYGFMVIFDTQAIAEGETAVSPESTEFTGSYTGISLRNALKVILSQFSLTYCIRNECLTITTPEDVQKSMTIKVYPVGDLVVRPTPLQGSPMGGGMGMGGMGGGMSSGGMGGMGMGGMGGMSGGMGGMSGGMGGMGGGMGGGMWNVPSKYEKLLKAQAIQSGLIRPNGGTLFAVVEKRPVETQNAKPVQAASVEKTDTPEVSERSGVIDLAKIDPKNPRAYWDSVYSVEPTERPTEKDTSFTAMKLLVDTYQAAEKDRPTKAKILVEQLYSAIRNGDVEPWMYESLAVALHLQGVPEKEVARAVLSAQDFCDNPLDMVFIGTFLQELGCRREALSVYSELVKVVPMRPEPMAEALYLADLLEDEEATKTLTIAVASLAWDGRWAKSVWQTASDMAATLLEKMRSEGRSADADAYQKELDEAIQRDCLVIVEYTGDAELDLIVKEPADTFCWFNNPRTTSGGILLNSPQRLEADASFGSDVKQAVYVCPKAFAGKYEVRVLKSWGKVAGDKFRIRVLKNIGSDFTTSLDESYVLGENGSLIEFELEKGRLDESLKEAELEAALVSNTEIENRAAVARQITALSSDAVLSGLNSASSTSRSVGGTIGESEKPASFANEEALVDWIFRDRQGGALGFQPVNQIIQTGTSMPALAIVSADRRYVRISAGSYFSSIAGVTTYDMSSGSTGGTGGMGGMSGGMGGMSGGMGGMSGGSYGGMSGGGMY